MKQVQQNLGNGETRVVDVPCPQLTPGHLLIRSQVSLISSGTERTLVTFGKSGWIGKARAQPEKVRMVLDKARTDGVAATVEAVRAKLDQPLPLGYSSAGTVLAVGPGVAGFSVGDRVASNGGHAEAVLVPMHLCARIPAAVDETQAAFTVLGAIALQGVRLAAPTLGETFAVFGVGLLGQLAVQLLRAQGCRVIAVDLDAERLALAARSGAETVNLSTGADPVATAQHVTQGRGVDGVLLTASTKSSDPVHQAAQMCRKRGRIVLVGVTGLELRRDDFYEKELTFQVSCSYGPGRYDADYEERGHDYPIGFVRWTEQRNLEAVLALMADGRLDVAPLISQRHRIEEAEAAYAAVADGEALAILLDYPPATEIADAQIQAQSVPLLEPAGGPPAQGSHPGSAPSVGMVGAGGYATKELLPALRRSGAMLHTIASGKGATGTYAGRKFGFRVSTTDTIALLAHPDIDTVVIATRHDSHADLAGQALRAGKHVFVEKPLATTAAQLQALEEAYRDSRRAAGGPLLMVGFNRRFAPQVLRMRELLAGLAEPKSFSMTVNAGFIPASHWTQDAQEGGGRIVGEGCHFIDLLRFLAAAPIISVQTSRLHHGPERTPSADNVTFTLAFADGSVGTVHYLANGHRAVPKERLEVFCGGRVLRLDNFRHLQGHGWPGFSRMRRWRQDKGNTACMLAFIAAVRSGAAAPIPFEELLEVTRVSLEIDAAGRGASIDPSRPGLSGQSR